jgi:hypothetical protein
LSVAVNATAKSIEAITLFVEDLERSKVFYQDEGR